MIIIMDHNLKQVDFHLYDNSDGKPVLVKSIAAPLDFGQDKKKLLPVIKILKSAGDVSAAGIRLRFSGDLFANPARIDGFFLEKYPALAPHFPFYIPITHALLKELSGYFSDIPFFAFFETALFQSLPEEEKRYALPEEYGKSLAIRRFGYHGLYHAYHAKRLNTTETVLSIVLDKQTTIGSLQNGKPQYISVGYSPLEGVMGRTTCGDLDPGVAFYLLRDRKQSFYGIDDLLKKESGFKGLTGFDLEIDDLYTQAGNEPAVHKAFEIYFNQILRHIGQALAVSAPLGGVVFGGRYCAALQPLVYRIAKKLAFLGPSLKPLPWETEGADWREVSTAHSRIPVCISHVPLQEIVLALTEEALTVFGNPS